MSIFFTYLYAASCMVFGVSFGIFLQKFRQNKVYTKRLKQIENEVQDGQPGWAFQKGAENAARVWCHADVAKINMDVKLAILFAESYGKYLNALQWCSSSDDFSYEGRAHEGWERIVEPLLRTSNDSRGTSRSHQ